MQGKPPVAQMPELIWPRNKENPFLPDLDFWQKPNSMFPEVQHACFQL